MMKLIAPGLLTVAVLSAPALAQSVFDGTWRTDPNTIQMSQRPQVIVLAKGVYACPTCLTKIKVKADGTDQSVSGSPYFDRVSINVIDSRTVKEIDKKNGKEVYAYTMSVSADGKSATYAFIDSSDTNATPVTANGTLARVAAGPNGSHAVSGSWSDTSKVQYSENALLVSYRVSGNSITMYSPNGQSYTAAFDGKDVPYAGDVGVTSVSLTMLRKGMFRQTNKRNGKVIGIRTMQVAADGSTAFLVNFDKLGGRTYKWTAHKLQNEEHDTR